MVLSFISLVMLIVPPLGVYLGSMDLTTCKTWMFVATIGWFVTAPFWIGNKEA